MVSGMPPPPPLPDPVRPVLVHGLDDARSALGAAAALGVPVTVVAGAASGALWFIRVVEAARAACGAVEVHAVLDCADHAGDAQGALAAGVRHVLFTGPPAAAARLADIAAARGAVVLTSLPPALELRGMRDAAAACRTWLSGG